MEGRLLSPEKYPPSGGDALAPPQRSQGRCFGTPQLPRDSLRVHAHCVPRMSANDEVGEYISVAQRYRYIPPTPPPIVLKEGSRSDFFPQAEDPTPRGILAQQLAEDSQQTHELARGSIKYDE